MALIEPPSHGGRLLAASRVFKRAAQEWVDLSTGISPWSWPVPALPQQVWQRLPEAEDGLVASAAHYYGCAPSCLLAIPGSQFAIGTLPRLAAKGDVAVPAWGYEEHAYRWQKAGHRLRYYRSFDELSAYLGEGALTAVVVINPNNPSAERLSSEALLEWVVRARASNCLMVVDEAFVDACPELSLCSHFSAERACPDNLVVLRSVGKFFGLAGLRLGFVLSAPERLLNFSESLPPWSINHPARWLGQKALLDTAWQQAQRLRLGRASQAWAGVLHRCFPMFEWRVAGLFITGFASTRVCQILYQVLAEHGLLIRVIEPEWESFSPQHSDATYAAVRFGLPSDDAWSHCEDVMDAASRIVSSMDIDFK